MGRRPTPRGRGKEREQEGVGDGRGAEQALADSRWGRGKGLGMGKENRSWDREGEREEVGQRPGREQEDEGSEGQEGEASVTHALQFLLVPDAPSQVRRLCIPAQLLQRHAAQRMAVGPCINNAMHPHYLLFGDLTLPHWQMNRY